MSRFQLLSNEDLSKLEDEASNKNTKKSTSTWLNVFASWAKWRKMDGKRIEEFEPCELDEALCMFYGEVRKGNGEDYEPECLAVMQASLDRHLKSVGYSHSIIRDKEFRKSCDVLEGKARLLRLSGKGKRPNATRAITRAEEDYLWEIGRLGYTTAKSLLHTVYYLLTEHFGLRARQEHFSMSMDNFERGISDDGNVEFVAFHEDPTKTRGSGLHPNKRDGIPKMFATGGDRCPVKIFNLYISKRPVELRESGRFYLGIDWSKNIKDSICYRKQPMGKNKISSILKEMVKDTDIEKTGKKVRNHSARKTVVKKLKQAKIPESSIVKITGHKNPAGLKAYDEGDEGEFIELSNAIHGTAFRQSLSTASSSNSIVPSAPNLFSSMPSSSTSQSVSVEQVEFAKQLTMPGSNIFCNCNVTFNVQHNKRRKMVIYDSSSSQSQ